MKTLTLLSLLLFVSGCATLSPEGRMVRAFVGTPPPECDFLGSITGSSAAGFSTDRHHVAKTNLMNKTAKAGGNFVRVIRDGTNVPFGTIEGEVYQCPSTVRLVAHEPTPDERMANEMERQNDIAEQRQRMEAFRQLYPAQQQQPYQIPVRRSTTTNCNKIGNQVTCTSH